MRAACRNCVPDERRPTVQGRGLAAGCGTGELWSGQRGAAGGEVPAVVAGIALVNGTEVRWAPGPGRYPGYYLSN